jgi:DnaK suppressor protein
MRTVPADVAIFAVAPGLPPETVNAVRMLGPDDSGAPREENGQATMLKRNGTAVAKTRRLDDLRTTLESRRAELSHEVQGRIRDVRSDATGDRNVLDEAESSEVDIQDDIGFALLQLKAETLKKIDTALRRIAEGDYGECFECGGEIAQARLRALPFAVRCRDCEAVREATDERERSAAYRGSSALFVDLSS